MADLYFSVYNIKQLKKAYADCKGETFVFQGQVILKDYAKYMIQYLEQRLRRVDK